MTTEMVAAANLQTQSQQFMSRQDSMKISADVGRQSSTLSSSALSSRDHSTLSSDAQVTSQCKMLDNGSYATIYETTNPNIVCKRITLLKNPTKKSNDKKDRKNPQQQVFDIRDELMNPSFIRDASVQQFVNFDNKFLSGLVRVNHEIDPDMTKATLDIYLPRAEMDLFKYFDKKEDEAHKKNLVLGTSEIRDIMFQLLSQIHYIHSCQIVHRDLKPENILIYSDTLLRNVELPNVNDNDNDQHSSMQLDDAVSSETNTGSKTKGNGNGVARDSDDDLDDDISTRRLKDIPLDPTQINYGFKTLCIADWGLSRPLSSISSDAQTCFSPGKYVCTLGYRSPELKSTSTQYTSKLDIWSLGTLMLQMLLEVNYSLSLPMFDIDECDFYTQIESSFSGIQKSSRLNDDLKPKNKKRMSDGKLKQLEVYVFDKIYEAAKKKPTSLKLTDWKYLVKHLYGSETCDLVFSLLAFDPLKRPHACVAMHHSYFAPYYSASQMKTAMAEPTAERQIVSRFIEIGVEANAKHRGEANTAKHSGKKLFEGTTTSSAASQAFFRVVSRIFERSTRKESKRPLETVFLAVTLFRRYMSCISIRKTWPKELATIPKCFGMDCNVYPPIALPLQTAQSLSQSSGFSLHSSSGFSLSHNSKNASDQPTPMTINDNTSANASANASNKWNKKKDEWLYLVGRLCLNLASACTSSKWEHSSDLPKVKHFFDECSKYYNHLQLDICQCLNWNLLTPTVLDFSRLFSEILTSSSSKEAFVANSTNTSLRSANKLLAPKKEEEALLLIALTQEKAFEFQPHVLALASLWKTYASTSTCVREGSITIKLNKMIKMYQISQNDMSEAVKFLNSIENLPNVSKDTWSLFNQAKVEMMRL